MNNMRIKDIFTEFQEEHMYDADTRRKIQTLIQDYFDVVTCAGETASLKCADASFAAPDTAFSSQHSNNFLNWSRWLAYLRSWLTQRSPMRGQL